jgi:hypothetical protein
MKGEKLPQKKKIIAQSNSPYFTDCSYSSHFPLDIEVIPSNVRMFEFPM